MITYYDLTIPFRSLLILGLFLELCLGGCLIVIVFQRKNIVLKSLVLIGTLSSGFFMILYTGQARANLRGLEVPVVSDWLCKCPVIFSITVFLIVFLMMGKLFIQEYLFFKNTVTRFSIKEGVDKLTSGLCFFREDGRVILVNQKMNELCFEISGNDLQNGKLFWEIICNGKVKEEVQRLSYGNNPDFRMSDGTIWTFLCENLGNIWQLTAADTTQIQSATDQLKEKNKELSALNLRLKLHNQNVEQLTRAKERLETKTRIHSELGQALLAARCYLLEESGNQILPLETWQRNIAMLRKESQVMDEEQPLELLMRITETMGISIKIDGEFPENEKIQNLFVQAAAETLTNAVSHAQAKTLYLKVHEYEDAYTLDIRNDGEKPKGKITEGGGLGSLRSKIENEGGIMTVHTEPEFNLIIKLIKERGDIL